MNTRDNTTPINVEFEGDGEDMVAEELFASIKAEVERRLDEGEGISVSTDVDLKKILETELERMLDGGDYRALYSVWQDLLFWRQKLDGECSDCGGVHLMSLRDIDGLFDIGSPDALERMIHDFSDYFDGTAYWARRQRVPADACGSRRIFSEIFYATGVEYDFWSTNEGDIKFRLDDAVVRFSLEMFAGIAPCDPMCDGCSEHAVRAEDELSERQPEPPSKAEGELQAMSKFFELLSSCLHQSAEMGTQHGIYQQWCQMVHFFGNAVKKGASPSDPYILDVAAKDIRFEISSPEFFLDVLRAYKPYFDGSEFRRLSGRSELSAEDVNSFRTELCVLDEGGAFESGSDFFCRGSASGSALDATEIGFVVDGEEFTFCIDPFHTASGEGA